MRDLFSKFASRMATAAGSYLAFLFAALIIVVWAVTGPLFHFSDTWQLVINTGTTIVTFLMVFLIQNSQNRDSRAIQLKLDELIRAVDSASDRLIDVEEGSDEQLERLSKVYRWRAQQERSVPEEGEEAKPDSAGRSTGLTA